MIRFIAEGRSSQQRALYSVLRVACLDYEPFRIEGPYGVPLPDQGMPSELHLITTPTPLRMVQP